MTYTQQATGLGQRPLAGGYGSAGKLLSLYSAYKAYKGGGKNASGSSGEAGVPGRGDPSLRSTPAPGEQAGVAPTEKGFGYYAGKYAREHLLPGRYQPATRVGLVDPKLRDPSPADIVGGMVANAYTYGLAGRTTPFKTRGINQAKFGAGR